MKNPAGKECIYFYGDYFRGRNHEECRLLLSHDQQWLPHFCDNCPIPKINQANACGNMIFTPTAYRPMFIFKSKLTIAIYCNKCECNVNNPIIGCGQCHPILDFIVPDNETNNTN
jgi:hypothetical protein